MGKQDLPVEVAWGRVPRLVWELQEPRHRPQRGPLGMGGCFRDKKRLRGSHRFRSIFNF